MPELWRYVDLRHQKNGQIAIWYGSRHVANILARHHDAIDLAESLVSAMNASAPENLEVYPGIFCRCPRNNLLHSETCAAYLEMVRRRQGKTA